LEQKLQQYSQSLFRTESLLTISLLYRDPEPMCLLRDHMESRLQVLELLSSYGQSLSWLLNLILLVLFAYSEGNVGMYICITKITGRNSVSESILTTSTILEVMRGRWASAALGAGIARRRAGAEMEQQQQAFDTQQQQAQRQIEAQQRQIEALQQQKSQQAPQPQTQQEDIQAKLLKYADLHQKGVLTDEEFKKLKADLLARI
jgi:hypothetical protein